MRITKIEQQKKDSSRYSIYIDDEFAFGIGEGELLEWGLKKGRELTQEEIDEIRRLDNCTKARDAALRFLGYRMRSTSEVRQRLRQKGFMADEINAALEFLCKYDYIDDMKFAMALIEDRMRLGGYGKIRITQELRQKGVSSSDIDLAYGELFPDGEQLETAELETAKGLLYSRHRGNDIEDTAELRRTMAYLLRRGFSSSTVKAAVKAYREEAD